MLFLCRYLDLLSQFVLKYKLATDCLYDFYPVDTFRQMPKPHIEPSDYSVQYDVKISPLIHAICHRSYRVVRILLMAGASVNFTTKDGVTPLMYAVRMVRNKCLCIFLNILIAEIEWHITVIIYTITVNLLE